MSDKESRVAIVGGSPIGSLPKHPNPNKSDLSMECEVTAPSMRWVEENEEDPFDGYYDTVSRERLAGSQHSDYEVANLVYMTPNIVNTSIAKERIRYLARQNYLVNKELKEAKDLLAKIQKDLLLRAELNCENGEGVAVVDLSSTLWESLNEMLSK